MLQYQVSRTTVREALSALSAQGLITVKRGRTGGSFVSSPTANSVVKSLDLFIKGQNIRFIDLSFAREAIEPAAAAQAAMCRTDEQLKKIYFQSQDCENNIVDIDLFVESNLNWHFSVIEASNNQLFITFMKSISAALHAATDLDVFDLEARKAVANIHWQIFEAIKAGNPEAARRRMSRHLSAYSEKLSSTDLSQDQKTG